MRQKALVPKKVKEEAIQKSRERLKLLKTKVDLKLKKKILSRYNMEHKWKSYKTNGTEEPT